MEARHIRGIGDGPEGSRAGALVRELAAHQCDPGWNPRVDTRGRGVGGGGVVETRLGTDKRCSHNLCEHA